MSGEVDAAHELVRAMFDLRAGPSLTSALDQDAAQMRDVMDAIGVDLEDPDVLSGIITGLAIAEHCLLASADVMAMSLPAWLRAVATVWCAAEVVRTFDT